MGYILILIIIGIVVFFFLNDRNKMLESQVDNYGGMKNKYSKLVQYLSEDPNAKISKISRDHIEISNIQRTTSTNFLLMQNFKQLDIEWNTNLGSMGKYSNKWSFKEPINEDYIIEVLNEYMMNFTRDLYKDFL